MCFRRKGPTATAEEVIDKAEETALKCVTEDMTTTTTEKNTKTVDAKTSVDKLCVSLLWFDKCDHNSSSRNNTCARCGDREGCGHCGYGGPMYFLLRFQMFRVERRGPTSTAFGVLRGDTGCLSSNSNERDRTLWISANPHAVMRNIPLNMRSELETETYPRVDVIIKALPTLQHLPALMRTVLIPFLSYL
jgi:hypothetical protein